MNNVMRICKGYLISLVMFGCFTLLGAVILKLTPFHEEWGFFYLLGAMTLVCLFIGLYMASHFQKAGLIVGLVFSAVLVLLILLIVSACFSSFLNTAMFTPAYFLPIGMGALGGILGANMKK